MNDDDTGPERSLLGCFLVLVAVGVFWAAVIVAIWLAYHGGRR